MPTQKEQIANLEARVTVLETQIAVSNLVLLRYLAVMTPRGGTSRTDVMKAFWPQRMTQMERDEQAKLEAWLTKLQGEGDGG